MTRLTMSADLGWQPLLWLDPGADGAGPRWAAESHRELGDGAWIDHTPGWLPHADEMFADLLQRVPWRADSRQMYDAVVNVPRLTAWFTDAAAVGSAAVTHSRDALTDHYRCQDDPFTSAGLCLYRDGADSVAWHGDRIGRGRTSDTMVAVLSLGSARSFLLRPRGGGSALRLTVGHGDLLVMGGSCQRTWDHAVPKTRRLTGPRISVQFRPRGVA